MGQGRDIPIYIRLERSGVCKKCVGRGLPHRKKHKDTAPTSGENPMPDSPPIYPLPLRGRVGVGFAHIPRERIAPTACPFISGIKQKQPKNSPSLAGRSPQRGRDGEGVDNIAYEPKSRFFTFAALSPVLSRFNSLSNLGRKRQLHQTDSKTTAASAGLHGI